MPRYIAPGRVVGIRCRVHRHVEFAFPATVLASFVDAEGNTIEVVDKEPIFLPGPSTLPCDGTVRATVLRSEPLRLFVTILEPDRLQSEDDLFEFWVARDHVEPIE